MKKLFLMLLLFSLCVSEAAKKKPNLIIIMADDLGWGDLSAYGAKQITTPNIDKLMSEGMRFERFFSTSSVSSPARASLLTGLFPYRAGVPGVIRNVEDDTWGNLRSDIVLLPQILKNSGYNTSLVGKWHLGLGKKDLPTNRGFDEFYGFIDDMMDDYYTHERFGVNQMFINSDRVDPKGHATDIFTDWACERIKNYSRNVENKSLFMFLSYNAPHVPLQAKPEYLKKIKADNPGIGDRRASYLGLVKHLDDSLAKVFETLKAENLYDDTIIVFISDNGGEAPHSDNGHFRDYKASMYDGGLAVAFSIKYKGLIAPNQTSHFEALTCDVMPTILDILNIDCPKNLDGKSFKKLLFEGGQEAFVRENHFYRLEKGGYNEAVKVGDFKLVKNDERKPPELFNTSKDPSERENLADNFPKVYRDLSAKLVGPLDKNGNPAKP